MQNDKRRGVIGILVFHKKEIRPFTYWYYTEYIAAGSEEMAKKFIEQIKEPYKVIYSNFK